MRFELTVALKYLIPKWRQLSVSIISLISVLVISLVVWLVILFLSVTEGIEKKWVEELVTLNAPVRMAPTAAYYNSYYYKIDSISLDANYSTKTIAEKLMASISDPYDPRVDMELPLGFPTPDRHADGTLKDLVKESFDAVKSLPYKGIRPHDYEVTFGNLRLQLAHQENTHDDLGQTFLTQVSYVASHDGDNTRVNHMVVPPGAEDYNNLLHAIEQTTGSVGYLDTAAPIQEVPESLEGNLKAFFKNLEVKKLRTAREGFILHPSLYPNQGKLKGVGIVRGNQIIKVIVPQSVQELASLESKLAAVGYSTAPTTLVFEEQQMHLNAEGPFYPIQGLQIVLDSGLDLKAELLEDSIEHASSLESIRFKVQGTVQQVNFGGQTAFKHLEIADAAQKKQRSDFEPFWVYVAEGGGCHVPSGHSSNPLGAGLLIAKHFKNNGVRLGDRGHLSYYALSGSSMQEQRIPVYVAGFYDPGMVPVGNKLIFVDSEITAILQGGTVVSDPMLGNGINIWFDHLDQAQKIKEDLQHALEARGIDKYWTVQSFHDYEFTRPILEQLRSDKNLFTLIAVIILVVACSNIISMLILLVNDKKKEIGILQSLGASPKRIAYIFGICGFATGLVSCLVGMTAAIFTLKNLQTLVNFLSFLQGRDAFQSAFYGASLPNELSFSVLSLVLIATMVISLLAGIIPAVKASRIQPTEILKSE